MNIWVLEHQVLAENQERKHTLHAEDVVIDHTMLQKDDVLNVDSALQQKLENITGLLNYEIIKHENICEQPRK